MALAAPRGFAKAQSLDSFILTPGGWKLLKDIIPGSVVIGKDGLPKKVLKETESTEMDLYRITTRDGRSTLCNLDHLWEVSIPQNTGDRKRIEPLKNILKNYKTPRLDKRTGVEYIEYRYFLDWSKPIQFEEKALPIDPYTLGCWLGDGTSSDAGFTTADPEILKYFPYKNKKRQAKYSYGLLGLHKDLRRNNLLKNKHIPNDYLYASVEQRTALLQGLLDTGGSVCRGGHIAEFCNTNKILIDGFVSLVRSLGGTATIGHGDCQCNGKTCYYWKVTSRFPESIQPFRLKRKLKRWTQSIKTKAAIVDIRFEKKGLGKCLQVEDDFYITDDFLVTHNSSIFSFFYPLFRCLESPCDILLVSSKAEYAEKNLLKIRAELEFNKLLIEDYGDQVTKVWRNDQLKLKNGSSILARGFEGKIRGIRPTVLIVDDIEDDELVRNDERRRKLEEWFRETLLPCRAPDSQVLVVGTLLHPFSLLSLLIKSPPSGWRSYKHTALDENLKSTWEEYWTTDRLLEIREEITPEAFEQEYMNNPIPDEMRRFKPNDIIYYDNLPSELTYTTTVDPAISLSKDADFSAIVTCGTDKDGLVYVVECIRKRFLPDELLEEIWRTYKKWNPIRIGIETIQFQKMLKYQFELQCKQRGVFPHIEELRLDVSDRGRKKSFRIEALQPLFHNHRILINRNMVELETELLSFPGGQHDDVIDALASQLELIRPYREKKSRHQFPANTFGAYWQEKKEKSRSSNIIKWHSFS